MAAPLPTWLPRSGIGRSAAGETALVSGNASADLYIHHRRPPQGQGPETPAGLARAQGILRTHRRNARPRFHRPDGSGLRGVDFRFGSTTAMDESPAARAVWSGLSSRCTVSAGVSDLACAEPSWPDGCRISRLPVWRRTPRALTPKSLAMAPTRSAGRCPALRPAPVKARTIVRGRPAGRRLPKACACRSGAPGVAAGVAPRAGRSLGCAPCPERRRPAEPGSPGCVSARAPAPPVGETSARR
jgi:hypothetical protein